MNETRETIGTLVRRLLLGLCACKIIINSIINHRPSISKRFIKRNKASFMTRELENKACVSEFQV